MEPARLENNSPHTDSTASGLGAPIWILELCQPQIKDVPDPSLAPLRPLGLYRATVVSAPALQKKRGVQLIENMGVAQGLTGFFFFAASDVLTHQTHSSTRGRREVCKHASVLSIAKPVSATPLPAVLLLKVKVAVSGAGGISPVGLW